MTDADLAAFLADQAGKLLLALRDRGTLHGAQLGAAGDRASDALIVDALARLRPDDGLLSEECADSPERLSRSRVWIVDPLDGTREYSEGRGDWAVHVALAIDGRPAVGALAVPSRGALLRSDSPPPQPARPAQVRLLVSRTRPPPEAVEAARLIGAELVPMGSAGAKTAALLLGDADLYFHSGGQHEWDNCAPAAVALGAGLDAARIDGSPLIYNRADTLVPDFLIGPPALTARLRTALKGEL